RQLFEGLGAAFLDPGAPRAADAEQGAVHFQDVSAARGPVQTVYVLGDEREAIGTEAPFQGDQGAMAGVGLNAPQNRTARMVEPPDEQGIALESKGGGHVLDPVAFPQTTAAAKSLQAAFRRDAGPCQHR